MGHIRDRWKDPARKGKGKRWQVKVQVDGRERDGGSFDNKEVAKRRLVEMESRIHRGQWIDPTDRTTLAEYAHQWAEARPHRPTTARRVSSLIEHHIAGTPLGRRRLAAVRPSEVQAWATGRAAALSPSTLRNLVSLLRSIYAAAVLDHLVGASPVVRVVLPTRERDRLVPLTIPQVRVLAEAMPARNRAMVTTQAGLGLRIGELLALRAQDVDFLRRSARVEYQIAPGARVRSDPKTPRSRRTIPLPATVADALAAHIAGFPPAADGTLFTTRFGRPYSHAYYGTVIFKAAIETANIAARTAARTDLAIPPETSSHDLRHHYASVLLAAGVSVVDVAERLGHETANLVLSTYGHLMPDSEDRTRRAFDDAWRAPDAGSADAATAQGRPE